MKSKENTDVLVIGFSPAGLMAARNIARKGLKVILIDKKDEPGNPSHPSNTFFKAMMDVAGEEIDDSYIIHRLKGAKIFAPSGKYVVVESPGYFIDRSKFDILYAQRIKDEGVDIRMSVEAYNVIRSNGRFTVSTSIGPITSKLVIVSDGINSRLASLLGLNPVKYPDDIAWAMEAEVTANNIGENDYFEYHVGSIAPGWKSTYSPCGGDKATLGVYVRRNGDDVSSFFENWITKFKKEKGLDSMTIGEKKVGGDPIATIPSQIVSDGVLVTGGSAGQSGIGYGMRAGQICGDVAAESILRNDTSTGFLSKYKKMWNDEFRYEYYLGRVALETLRKMSDKEIDNLMETFIDEDISSIAGTPVQKGIKMARIMLKNNPRSMLSMLAILRNK